MSFDEAALRLELIRDEGIRLKPYQDTVGKTTIGIGHNLTDRGISTAVMELMYHEDVSGSASALDKHTPWWRSLSDVRQRVMLNMVFNMGWSNADGSHGLVTFKNTLALIQGGNYDAAAAGMLNSTWAQQVGPRATRLADMMRRG